MKSIDQLPTAMEYSRLLREKLLSDPHRPAYHFSVPGEIGMPGDPNGAFYANGRYHLMYLYECRSDGYRWGHISSADLVHWRAHPDALIPDELDGGIFSGGAFVDDDGACYLTYWGLSVDGKNEGGVRIARSSDRYYDHWEKFADYALPCTRTGIHEMVDSEGGAVVLGCSDPSNIWKKGGKYYMQMGNLPVLLHYKRDGLNQYSPEEISDANAPENAKGDWTELMESDDLVHWAFRHRFYRRSAANKWTQENEDDMCPSFLPLPSDQDGGALSEKHLQLFISHNKGCQYYIGTYDSEGDCFLPERHGRMTWVDNTFFAPEALLDQNNRQIMWAWLLDNREDELQYGWSGVFSMPRSLWLRQDGTLGIAPVREMRNLRYREKQVSSAVLKQQKLELSGADGRCCEITCTVDVRNAAKAGLVLRASADGSVRTIVYYDTSAKELVFDSTNSGTAGRMTVERAPLMLAENELLQLDVFIDNSVVEVFANERQAICRRVYPQGEDSERLYLFAEGEAMFDGIATYDLMPSFFF